MDGHTPRLGERAASLGGRLATRVPVLGALVLTAGSAPSAGAPAASGASSQPSAAQPAALSALGTTGELNGYSEESHGV